MSGTGHVITFYSYKGGTGRSMALANFAWILASYGARVLAIDWDLEAPGLHRYFRPFLIDPDLAETDGLIDLCWALAGAALANAAPMSLNTPSVTPSMTADFVRDAIEDSARRLDWHWPGDGCIDLIGAGRQGPGYSERVNTFDWQGFYKLGGLDMLLSAMGHVRDTYDWVLIDSRTGVSDTAGVCTIQLPDAVVGCFTLNRQSIEGMNAVLRSIRAYDAGGISGRDIALFPVATRIENAEQQRLERSRDYARRLLADLLPKEFLSHTRSYWDRMEISYRPAYAFEEVLAAFGDATGFGGAADTMASQMEALAQLITGNDMLRVPEVIEADRTRVLRAYSLGDDVEAARRKPATDADSDFLRGLHAKEQQWRSSGFPWQNLLSQRELDLLTADDRAVFGRDMAFYHANSLRLPQFMGRLDMAFFVSGLTAVAAGIAAYIFWLRPDLYAAAPSPADAATHARPNAGLAAIWAAYAGFLAGATMALIWGSLMNRAASKPYGMRLINVLGLLVMGPLRPEVRDFAPVAPPGVTAGA